MTSSIEYWDKIRSNTWCIRRLDFIKEAAVIDTMILSLIEEKNELLKKHKINDMAEGLRPPYGLKVSND